MRGEFRTAGVRVSPEVIELVVEAVGSDLRELAAACSQLVADTGGKIDASAVQRYYSGKAECPDSMSPTRRSRGIGAARWSRCGGRCTGVCRTCCSPTPSPTRCTRSPGWLGRSRRPVPNGVGVGHAAVEDQEGAGAGPRLDPASIGEALQVVARLNAEVKGQAADADYAVEAAVQRIVALHGGR